METAPSLLTRCHATKSILCIADPTKTAGWAHLKYWNYSVNEMGMEDCLAQIDHIHVVKCQELNISAGPAPEGVERSSPFSWENPP